MCKFREGFPKSARLLTSESYSRVFRKADKSYDRCFTVLWRPNGSSKARLGLAVSKKNVRRAVDRNLLKRIIRESFRMRKDDLAGVDVVVLSRRGVPVHKKRLLGDSLQGHWQRLIEQRVLSLRNRQLQ